MSKKIKLYQFVSGSWPDKIGDTTLYYTENYSRRAHSVGGIFLDNPPKLSADSAGLVWRYYHDTDRYLLIHVQGSQVVNLSMGRNYPFRASYEVSRDDMNAIHFNLPAILKAVPRIANIKGGRVALEKEVDDHTTWPRSTGALAGNILQAILQGKQLFIALEVSGREYHEDKIFEAPELQVLIGAIGLLPDDVRRYAAFGFCVDDCYSLVLSDVPVVVYLKGRHIDIPKESVCTTWLEATTHIVIKSNGTSISFPFPGANEKLMPADQLQRAIVVSEKKITELSGEDWPVWLSLKHTLAEIETNAWETFQDFYGRMDTETQKKYVESVKKNSINWKMRGLTENLFDLMEYDEEQVRQLQRRTVPLMHLLQKDGKYDYLYPKGKLPQGMLTAINANFLQDLKLTEVDSNLGKDRAERIVKERIKRWYGIFKEYGRTDDHDVRMAFKGLFELYIIPNLTLQADLLQYMKEYPFISSKCYQKPHDYQPLTEKEQRGLKTDYQALFEKWKKDAIEGIQFDSTNTVLDLLGRVNDKNKHIEQLKAEALKQIKPEQLSELLLKEKDDTIGYCEKLLDAMVKLSKEWAGWIGGTALPAIEEVLFGDNKKSGAVAEDPLDVKQWASICEKYSKTYPHVFFLIMRRFDELLSGQETVDKLCENAKKYFVPSRVNELAAEGPKQVEHSGITVTWVFSAKEKKAEKSPKKDYLECDKAYPFIVELINIVKKMKNKEETQNFKRLFNELKAAKKTKRNMQKQLSVGFVAGIMLGILCAILYNNIHSGIAREETPKEVIQSKEHRIVFAKSATLDKQLMLQLSSMALQDTIENITIGDSLFSNVCLTDMEMLLRCNAAYYHATDTAKFTEMTAIFREDIKDVITRNQKKDTVCISPKPGQTLLEAAVNHPQQLLSDIRYETNDEMGQRVEKVIDIPNSTLRSTMFKNDTVNIYMDKPRFYFQVIQAIEAKLKEDNSTVRIAY